MKKMVLLFLIFVLGTTFAFADAMGNSDNGKDDSPASFKNGYIGIGAGVDLTNSDWNSSGVTYGIGGLAQVFGGYQFDKNLAVQADIENSLAEGTYAQNLISQYNLRGLIEVKYAFDVPVCQPYVLAGGGLVYSLLNQPTGYTTSVNADALAGLGAQFDLTSDSHIYVEAKYNFILSSVSSLQDIPITAGIWTGF